MPINSENKSYAERTTDWQMIRDSVQGQRAIKDRAEKYLPVPPGMSGSGGSQVLAGGKQVKSGRYSFYLSFAEFPEIIAPSLSGYQGVIHSNPPKVELPEKMKYLLEDATPEKEPLQVLWERVTREVLTTGRIGLLSDVSEQDDKVRLSSYSAENIINWRVQPLRVGGGPDLVVVREFQDVIREDDDFEFKEQVLYHEIRLINGKYALRTWSGPGGAITPGVVNSELKVIRDWTTPTLFGKEFPFIPIAIINTEEMGFSYGPIPSLPIVRRALSIYRKTADYNRSLYIKGDPQIVISGITAGDAPTKIGGESIWTLPNPQAKATYLDIDGDGIPLMRQSINDEFDRFYQEGGRLLDTAERGAESGEALRRRQAANQVSLRSIAQNTGEAMQAILRKIAELMGLDQETVEFVADLDFAEPNMDGQGLLDIMLAKSQGAPISSSSVHALMERGGMTQITFEKEMDEISTEDSGVSGLPMVEPTAVELIE